MALVALMLAGKVFQMLKFRTMHLDAELNTGWRGNTSIEMRLEYDLYYIEHWSLWLDLKIMALTLWKGFVHRHAY